MFNAWLFNGSPYAGSTNGVRVIFASAVFASTASADPFASNIRPGEAHSDWNTYVEASTVVDHAGSIDAYVNAYVDRTRPYDLLEIDLDGITVSEASSYAYRAGAIEADGFTYVESNEVVHSFFATLDANAFVEDDALRTAYAFVDMDVHGSAEVEAGHIYQASVVASVWASVDPVDRYMYAGGTADVDSTSTFTTYGIINGIHRSQLELIAESCTDIEGTRVAGMSAEADVHSVAEFKPYPWLGSEAFAYVNASMHATWWTYIDTHANVVSETSIIAAPLVYRATDATVTTHTEVYAKWSRKVSPSTQFVSGIGFADIDALRTRHEEISIEAAGVLDESSRIAIRGFVDASAVATVYANAWRTVFVDTEINAHAAISNSRASVNLLNPAPDWRQMIVPEENRTMIVKSENRTMKVA